MTQSNNVHLISDHIPNGFRIALIALKSIHHISCVGKSRFSKRQCLENIAAIADIAIDEIQDKTQ